MAQSSRSPQEQVTATGIRIVGSAAAALVAQVAAIQLQPPAPADILWAARFRARPRLGSGSAVPALLQAVSEALHATWDACPPLTRDTPISRPTSRFAGLSWDVLGQAGAWRGELIWRHTHPVLAGTPCTSHLVIDEQQHLTTLTLATAADGGVSGVRGFAGAGQSRPTLIDRLRQVVSLAPVDFEDTPQILSKWDVAPFVTNVLLGEQRTWPVAVLAPQEGGGYLVDPDALASELYGLAPLYLLENHDCTFALTDEIGDRRLSAYWGALRVYRPDFTCADRSEDHWLLLRDRVEDPVQRATLLGHLGRFTAHRVLPIDGVAARRALLERAKPQPEPAATPTSTTTVGPTAPTPTAPPQAAPTPAVAEPTVTPVAAAAVSATPAGVAVLPVAVSESLEALPGVMQHLVAQLSDLSGTIAHLVAANARLADEIGRLRTATAVRSSSSNALERRLDKIDALLRPPAATDSEEVTPTGEAEEEHDTSTSLVDVIRHAVDEYSDALLILDSSEKAAAASSYRDTDRLGAILQVMAEVARRRQEGRLDTGLRAAFQEYGVDYRQGVAKSTSDKLLRQYHFAGPNGTVYECYEHIAIGVNPRHLLRIYFTSRAMSEPRFVIGHIGRHLDVLSTN